MAKTTTRTVLNMTNATLRLLINIILFAVIIVLIYKYSWEVYRFSYRVFGADPVDSKYETVGKDITVKIDKGDSALTIGAKLELARAIHDKLSFYIRARLMGAKFHPGLYTVNTTMTYDEMYEVFAGESNAVDEESQ
jgi:cell division protein YceG involved in septum cleavage